MRARYGRLCDQNILQVTGVTNPLGLGFEAQAMVGVRTTGPPEHIADEIAKWDEADYVVVTTGRFDLLVEVVTADRRGLLDVTNRIRALPEVVSTETFLYLELWKQLYDWGAAESTRRRSCRSELDTCRRAAGGGRQGVRRAPARSTASRSRSRAARSSRCSGRPGCGKTTTLRMIGGFEEPTSGRILLGDRDVVGLPPYKRDVNTVFQSYALFPHMTIADNVAFGLERKRIAKGEVRTRVSEVLELVDLAGRENRKPSQLSGGQQQRVALARAIVNNPRVLLLDEPLGALDLKLRKQMQLELKRIQHEVGITFVHVTHDQEEAMTMADTIAVMNGGRIEQLGAPAELYERPRHRVRRRLPRQVEPARRDGGRRTALVRLADGSELARTDERVAGADRDRRPAREDRPRRAAERIDFRARSRSRRTSASRPRSSSRRAVGELTVFHQNVEAGGVVPPLGSPVSVSWAPEATFVVERGEGEHRMTMRMTRRTLVQRGAAGATILSLPGLLAACGGGGGGGGGGGELEDVLNFANWQLLHRHRRADEEAPSLDEFTAKTGIKVNYFEEINDERRVLREDPGAALEGPGDRPGHLRRSPTTRASRAS